MANATSEVIWLVRLLQDFSVSIGKPITLICDNQSAIYNAKNPIQHERTMHIGVDCHFTTEKVLEGLLQLSYLPTKNQLADLFTKILTSRHFSHLLSKLGVTS